MRVPKPTPERDRVATLSHFCRVPDLQFPLPVWVLVLPGFPFRVPQVPVCESVSDALSVPFRIRASVSEHAPQRRHGL